MCPAPGMSGVPQGAPLGGTLGRRLTSTPDPQVTQLRVFVSVLDVNDNPPVFPFEVKVERVPEVSVRGARAGTGGIEG